MRRSAPIDRPCRRLAAALLAALALMLLPCVASAADAHRFDGQWLTTVSCLDSRGGLGYSYRFLGVVKDGVYHGLHGTLGQPGSLQVDGPIAADGTGQLYAQGLTGSKEFVPGTDTPRGTDYGYHIDAHFGATAGTGKRVEGRPCTVEFEKQ
jgi:hypothetical protein